MFRVGKDQTGQYLEIELDFRHAPLKTNESGCNANTKTVNTPRLKPQNKFVSDGGKSPIFEEREDATRYIPAKRRFSFLFRPCRKREAFGPENE